MKIIILGEITEFSKLLSSGLSERGFDLETVGRRQFMGAVDAVIMVGPAADDAMIQGLSEVRTAQPSALVLVATDHDRLDERIACYEAGADDCIFKPFHFSELVAKLRAFERRKASYAAISLLRSSDATIDPITLELRVEGRVQGLTKREAELLTLLARADGGPVRREEVLREAWGAPHWMTNNSVDVYVGYARRKLSLVMADVTIAAVRGIGFQLVARPMSPRRSAEQSS